MRRRRGAAEQEREVQGWRSSGLTAGQYAARRGYSVASLMRWAKAAPAEVGATGAAPRFVQLLVATSPRSSVLVVEVGGARIRVEPGFDAEHLRAVVAALAGGAPC